MAEYASMVIDLRVVECSDSFRRLRLANVLFGGLLPSYHYPEDETMGASAMERQSTSTGADLEQ